MFKPWDRSLRDWQKNAYYEYFTTNKRNFLLVATPGAGKTVAAARIAHHLLSTDAVERIVVVCPSEHLKRQWHDALAANGIEIDYKWRNASGVIAIDYHGIAATYQQIASNPDIHRIHCRRKTLVIFDEVHHAGDEQSWGDSIKEAFDPATRRLLLSGTPFRDKGAIPYVTYVDDGTGVLRSKADFSYGYGPALRDDVCRPILFPSYQGTMEWESNFNHYKATFQDALPEEEARRRLKTALHPEGDWIRDVLRDANQRLTELRSNGHPIAAGLVLCSNAVHARQIADRLNRVTGETATIVLSEDDNASDRIKEFADGMARWIVAVRMVSEGVDIPRLRVGVYATHWITELFFRQVVGRFVRVTEGVEEQSAFLYIPKEETLVAFAQRIKEERDHELEQEIEGSKLPLTGGKGAVQQPFYTFQAAEARPDDVIYNHDAIRQAEIEEARNLAIAAGLVAVPPEKIAHLFRLRGTPLSATTQPSVVEPKTDTLREQKDKKRKLIKRLVVQLIHESGKALDYQSVYYRLMQIDGTKIEHCTIEQMQARVDFLHTWIKEHRDG